LLLKGYPNAIWTETVVDQRYDAPGGCSLFRTAELNDAEAVKLASLFPDYVTLVQREYKNGASRREVIVRWKDALRDGLKHRERQRLIA
jgi:hypothetical protein